MSNAALKLYDELTNAGEDKTRAKLIAEAFGQLEERYPAVKEIATQSNVRETELRLQKEIEVVRLQIKETEAKLQKDIDGVRLQIKETEAKLQKDLGDVRLEIKTLEVKMVTALHRHTLWVIGSVGAIAGLIRLLDFFLHK